jgi:predicted unusual protein kinase regulating ubiquinone biosynthesis (AarF/ABC1/UbiB family)
VARKDLGGRLGRGARLARTGARGAFGLASATARRLAGDETADAQAHEELANRLAEVLGEMKGAAMKLGQLLSFVDLDLPDDLRSTYHEALARLRDDAPPMDPVAIRRVITEDFGAPPEAIFASWEDAPLAAASIGQVHAAKLDDGREVVVKVQYPGVADAVRADLRNAEAFTPLARVLSPNLEVEPLVEELRERIEDELDYEREAQYQRAFATRYAGHPFIMVPDIVGELCRRRVLVSERVYGRRFDEFAASAGDQERQQVGEIIFRYAFGSIGRFRLFNGDPHPGNYLIDVGDGDANPRVGFIDYGSVKLFSRERWRQMREVDEAVIRDDRDGFVQAMRGAGFVPPTATIDEDLVYEWFRLYTRPILAEPPFRFTPEFAAEVLRTITDPRSPYADVLRRLNLPPDYLLLNRIQWGLNSVLGRLDAANDWRGIRDEYVNDAEPATELGRLDQDWWQARSPQIDPPA